MMRDVMVTYVPGFWSVKGVNSTVLMLILVYGSDELLTECVVVWGKRGLSWDEDDEIFRREFRTRSQATLVCSDRR
jgi:hypothetical protein